MPPRFSVLIPTYERAALLPALLEAWAGIEPPRGGYEIILADDGSSSPPMQLVEFYASRIPLKFLQLPHGGVSATRQAALEVCQGEFALITDDDCRPTPGLLRAYEDALKEFPERALGGPVINLLTGNIYSETTQTITTYVAKAWNSGPDGPVFFTGSNFLLPRKALEKIGGFDRAWTSRTGEDRDLCRRWAEAGLSMAYVPEAVMGHAHALDFPAFIRQHFHYGQGRSRSEVRRKKRGAGAPAWSGPGFYAGLFLAPWRAFPPLKAAQACLLTACSQVATVCGSMQACLVHKRDGV
ncbi:MAG: glycosyltransferase [Chthoniobacterales bacterium]|nr:glycosyltransferase [Chthoniobacterales bacterium]